MKLAGANALLAGRYQVDGLKPEAHRNVAGLKHGAHADSEGLAAPVAFVEPYAGRLTPQGADAGRAAAVLAHGAIWPQLGLDVGKGTGFVVEMLGRDVGLYGGSSLATVLTVITGYVKRNFANPTARRWHPARPRG